MGTNFLLTFSGGYQDQGPVDYPGRLLTADFFHSRNFSAEFETVRAAGTLRDVEISAYRNAVSHGMNNLGKPTRTAVPMGVRTPPFGLDIRVDSDIVVRRDGQAWTGLGDRGRSTSGETSTARSGTRDERSRA